MPRFHFHILDGKNLTDDIGAELADIDAAKVEAVRIVGEVLTSEGLSADGWQGKTWKIVVNDHPSPGNGRTYYTLTLSVSDGSSN